MLPHVANDDCADSKQMSISCFAILLNHDAVDDDMFQKGLSEDDCSLLGFCCNPNSRLKL